MKTPAEKAISFLFVSHPAKDPEMRWTARLSFPPGSAAETVLPIEVLDCTGAPIPQAVFEFAGKRLEVKDGRAEITYADFVRGKHDTALWLHRRGMYPVPGGLTFG